MREIIRTGIQCLKDNGIKYTYGLTVNYIRREIFPKKSRQKYKSYESDDAKTAYINYLEWLNLILRDRKNNPDFVEITDTPYIRQRNDAKVIAWYLPQYYKIPKNDIYHGEGFTEWTNTTRAIPLFTGHYQPHLPYDVGFYNLTMKSALERQVELAKKYGIYGFCFDYYWFSGEKIMEKPTELFLANRDLDLHYCINWCLENWSTVWDGGARELIYEQKLTESDAAGFLKDILPYFQDERYIRIDGKPVLMCYGCNTVEREIFVRFVDKLRKLVKEQGISDLYIMLCVGGFSGSVKDWGGDAVVEYPTINMGACNKFEVDGYINPNFISREGLLDYQGMIDSKSYMRNYSEENVYRAAMVNFDNSARKAYSENCYITVNASPDGYRYWISEIIKDSMRTHNRDNNYVFVLAWNEWAEGAHLEPDLRYGYAYLNATRVAIEENRKLDTTLIRDEISNLEERLIEPIYFYIHCIESLGDVIACEPIARYLKSIKPDSKVFWIVKKQYSEVIKYNPYIDEIIEVDYLSQSIDILNDKRKEENSIIVDCHQNHRRCTVTDRYHYNPANPQIDEYTYLNYGSLLANFCLSAGLEPLSIAPKFYLRDNIEIPFELPDKYIVVHCKSAELCKDWQPKKWNSLISQLIAEGYSIIEVGMQAQVSVKNKEYIDCTDIRDIQVIAKIIESADFFFGIDSSFAHVANCFNIPGVLIFGKYKYFDKPMMYTGGYASTNAKIIYARDNGTAADVTVNEVMNAFYDLLKSASI